MQRTTPRLYTPSLSQRLAAFGLASVASLALLSGVSQQADHTLDRVMLAQASGPVQVVVVTAQRLSRS